LPPAYSLIFSELDSRFQVLYEKLLSTLSQYLYRVINMDLVSVFCRQISNFPSNIVEEAVFSPSYVFGNFIKIRWT
jgi:hypothetical protein